MFRMLYIKDLLKIAFLYAILIVIQFVCFFCFFLNYRKIRFCLVISNLVIPIPPDDWENQFLNTGDDHNP